MTQGGRKSERNRHKEEKKEKIREKTCNGTNLNDKATDFS